MARWWMASPFVKLILLFLVRILEDLALMHPSSMACREELEPRGLLSLMWITFALCHTFYIMWISWWRSLATPWGLATSIGQSIRGCLSFMAMTRWSMPRCCRTGLSASSSARWRNSLASCSLWILLVRK